MSAAYSDRNLLFGVLALQMDFLDRDALIAAMNAWIQDKTKPLGDILVKQQTLHPDERDVLNALVQKHLDRHCGDVEKSLAAIPVPTPLRDELANLPDADVQASIARLPTPSVSDKPGPLPSTVSVVKPVGGLRYQILRPHDRGGIGEVFVALDQELNRQVALKEIQEHHADDPHSCSRFVREAEITGGLEHPGIVPVYGLGQYADGRPFYAMRFIQGETLKDAIARYHRTLADGSGARSPEFEFRTLLTRFVAVCNAIAYAHSRGVIHRDLKPSNIMLGKYGETLVVDWGMAKAGVQEPARSVSEGLPEPSLVPILSDAIETQAGAAMGTPAYMSPEQASGRLDLLGPANDIYSLGATLYTLLTGRPPIEGKDTAEILRKAQRGEWLPLRQVKPDVPPALDAVCRKAMAPSRSERYLTVLALAADVERWLGDEPLAVYREPWLVRSRRWMRRHRTLVSTAVGALVVALVGTTVGLVIVSEAEKTALAQKEEARFNQYVAQMNLVQRDYEANNIVRVRELLEAQVPREAGATDFRNFEWYYWQRMAHRELLILKGHAEEPATSVSFSPDGRRLASAGYDRMVRVWDAATGKELLTLKGHTREVQSVVFSPDGQRLASATPTQVLVWDASTGKELLTVKGYTNGVNDVAFGRNFVAFSPDGRRLATGGFGSTARVLDAVTGKELLILKGHMGGVNGVSFSPDRRRLASAGGVDATVRVWDAATGKELLTVKGHTGPITGVSFSPDGRRLASANRVGDQTVRVWDAVTGKELLRVKGHSGSLASVSFSPDGRRLASAGDDSTVHIWDAATGKELLNLKGPYRFSGISFSPDGWRLASAGWDGTVCIWDALTGQEQLILKEHTGRVHSVSFSPDGRRLASAVGDSTARVWDAVTGQELLAFKGHTRPVLCVSFSPDGQRLASAGTDNTVRVWDAATGKELLTLTPNGITFWFTGVSFSPDGRQLASVGDSVVRVWDVATGKELLALKDGGKKVAFSPDGRRLASVAPNQTVRVWAVDTGKELLAFKGNTSGAECISFSPDGRRLVSADNAIVHVWDAATGQELLTVKGHSQPITGVFFSPDGRRLVSASYDATVRVWDAATGQELLTLKGHTGTVWGVSFSADGWRLASADQDCIRVWEASTVPDEVWRQRWLVSQVVSLFEELPVREEVVDALRKDRFLAETDREFALQTALTYPESSITSWQRNKAKKLAIAAGNVVQARDAGEDDYARALRQAEAAVHWAPSDGPIVGTLGIAQYRSGRYADALATLTKSAKLKAGSVPPGIVLTQAFLNSVTYPSDLAFHAMAQYQLGKKDEARATLSRLRDAMKDPRWTDNAGSVNHSFLREAEELIEGKTTGKPK